MKTPRAIARVRRAVLALSAVVALGVPSSGVSAQRGTLHAQAARVDDAAHLFTLGLRYTRVLGDSQAALPRPGETVERAGRRWLFTASGGAGLARSRGPVHEYRGTVVGQAGVLYRVETRVESFGLVAYANLEPGLVGPAAVVRAFTILEVLGGVGKLEDHDGASWFAGVAVSVALFGDLAR